MVRKLKFHEQKLLKKVDFLKWKNDDAKHQVEVMRRYRLPKREDYIGYNRLCGEIRHLAHQITLLNPQDPFRRKQEKELLEKLYHLGVIATKTTFSACEKISVAAFCRRRLPIVMCRLKMAETVQEAVTLVEQGHVRVGPDVVTDPSMLINRNLEDFITWVDSSKIKRKIQKYNDKLDDFDLLL